MQPEQEAHCGVPPGHGGRRWLVIQNSKATRFPAIDSIVCQIISMETKEGVTKVGTQSDVPLPALPGLDRWSYVCCSQIHSVPQKSLYRNLGVLPEPWMWKVDDALILALGLSATAIRRAREETSGRVLIPGGRLAKLSQ
jgi:mRNA-degrading endonuclease toxin of MazEF toxin-antitoxin module